MIILTGVLALLLFSICGVCLYLLGCCTYSFLIRKKLSRYEDDLTDLLQLMGILTVIAYSTGYAGVFLIT